MTQVWKFPIVSMDNAVQMPLGAKILSTAFQREELQIWAAVDPTQPKGVRNIRVVGTGHDAPDLDGTFVGTAFHPLGLVFHVFDYGF